MKEQDKNEYTRLKKKLKDLSTIASITEADTLVKELDTKVRQVLSYKR